MSSPIEPPAGPPTRGTGPRPANLPMRVAAGRSGLVRLAQGGQRRLRRLRRRLRRRGRRVVEWLVVRVEGTRLTGLALALMVALLFRPVRAASLARTRRRPARVTLAHLVDAVRTATERVRAGSGFRLRSLTLSNGADLSLRIGGSRLALDAVSALTVRRADGRGPTTVVPGSLVRSGPQRLLLAARVPSEALLETSAPMVVGVDLPSGSADLVVGRTAELQQRWNARSYTEQGWPARVEVSRRRRLTLTASQRPQVSVSHSVQRSAAGVSVWWSDPGIDLSVMRFIRRSDRRLVAMNGPLGDGSGHIVRLDLAKLVDPGQDWDIRVIGDAYRWVPLLCAPGEFPPMRRRTAFGTSYLVAPGYGMVKVHLYYTGHNHLAIRVRPTKRAV